MSSARPAFPRSCGAVRRLGEPPPQTKAACICAAIARIAACAADPQATSHINVEQTLALVDKLLARGIYVLFLSTNQVFDGRVAACCARRAVFAGQRIRPAEGAHRNGAPRAYGARRAGRDPAACQGRVARYAADCRLDRGFVGGPAGARFRDMPLAPTPTSLVCAAIAALLKHRASGIFQLTGPRDVTYADVGRFLADRLGVDAALVKETSARAAGLPEGATPRNTTLDSTLLREQYGLEAPDAWDVVGQALAETRRPMLQSADSQPQ